MVHNEAAAQCCSAASFVSGRANSRIPAVIWQGGWGKMKRELDAEPGDRLLIQLDPSGRLHITNLSLDGDSSGGGGGGSIYGSHDEQAPPLPLPAGLAAALASPDLQQQPSHSGSFDGAASFSDAGAAGAELDGTAAGDAAAADASPPQALPRALVAPQAASLAADASAAAASQEAAHPAAPQQLRLADPYDFKML